MRATTIRVRGKRTTKHTRGDKSGGGATPNQDILKEINELLANNKVEMPIAKTFKISEFKEAYQFAKNGGAVGKVVFTIP